MSCPCTWRNSAHLNPYPMPFFLNKKSTPILQCLMECMPCSCPWHVTTHLNPNPDVLLHIQPPGGASPLLLTNFMSPLASHTLHLLFFFFAFGRKFFSPGWCVSPALGSDLEGQLPQVSDKPLPSICCTNGSGPPWAVMCSSPEQHRMGDPWVLAMTPLATTFLTAPLALALRAELR